MTEIHYFQRYAQLENMVTNNTLLLLSRVNQDNSTRFEQFLNLLIDDENFSLAIGPTFRQQTKGKHSVPDGEISQTSLKIVVEAKLYGNPSSEQLINHLDAFGEESRKILLLVDKVEPTPALLNEVKSAIGTKKPGVQFLTTTFRNICELLGSLISDFEIEMQELLKDYEAFCSEMELIPTDWQQMIAFPASASHEDNKKFGLYYRPSDRAERPSAFIGLYWDKSIRLIGRVTKTVLVDLDSDGQELTCTDEDGTIVQITEEEKERILGAILAATEIGKEWIISNGHRFTLVDKFCETDFSKKSFSGMRGQTYFQLSDILNESIENLETQQIADQLRSREWD